MKRPLNKKSGGNCEKHQEQWIRSSYAYIQDDSDMMTKVCSWNAEYSYEEKQNADN
jgi:hypothetical protein